MPEDPHIDEKDEHAVNEEEQDRSLRRRVVRTVLVAVGSLLGAIVLLVLLFILALQSNWGGQRFADFLLGLSNPFDEAVTEYDELQGNFLSGVTFVNLRITRVDTFLVDTLSRDPLRLDWAHYDSLLADTGSFDAVHFDTVRMARVDTLRIGYDLLSLFRKRVEITRLHLIDPNLHAQQEADGTWDLFAPFSDTTTGDTTALFTFVMEDVKVTDGDLVMEYYPPWRDSTLRVAEVNGQITDLIIDGPDVELKLDSLAGRYMLPQQDYWTSLRAEGEFVDDVLQVADLRLWSPHSDVEGRGTLRLPGEEADPADMEFVLQTDPLAFRDLAFVAPNVNPNAAAYLDVRIGGTTRQIKINAEGNLADGGRIAIDGTVSPGGDGPLRYDLEGQIRRFDPRYITGGNEDAAPLLLNGDFDVDLSGTSAEQLDGEASATLFDTRLGGLVIQRGALATQWEDGSVTLDTDLNLAEAGFVSAEGRVRPFAETPTYNLDGRLRDFNIAAFSEGEDQQSDITGSFEVDGAGFDPQRAEATARVDLAPSTLNEYRIESGVLDLRLADGELTYGSRLLFPEGFVAANGRVVFGEDLRFTVERGRFENMDLAALMGQDAQSSVTGSFSLSGTGTVPQRMRLDASLDLTATHYGTYAFDAVDVDVSLRNGLLSASGDADLGDAGAVQLALQTRPFDAVPRFDFERARFQNLNLGALTQNPNLDTDLTGRANFDVRGFDPQVMRLDGRFVLDASRINEQTIDGATVDAVLSDGRLDFDANLNLPEGRVQVAGNASPFLDTPTYDVQRGSFRNVNLGAFTGNPSLSSSLTGTFDVEGYGFTPETMNVEGQVRLEDSRLNEQPIQMANLSGTWNEGRLDFRGTLDVPEGETTVAGTARLLQDVPTYTISQGDFQGLNVGALTGNPDLQTSLNGTVALDGRGLDPETMTLNARFDFAQSLINEETLLGGQVAAELDGGTLRLGTSLDFEEGAAQVDAVAQPFADPLSYDAEGSLTNLDIDGILGIDTLSAGATVQFDVTGTGLDPETMTLEGQLTSSEAHYDEAELDTLFTDFRLQDGLLRMDTLLLRSTVADIRGGGYVALFDTLGTGASDFDFIANVKDPEPIRPLIGAQTLQLEAGRIEGHVYGTDGALRFDVEGDIQSLAYNDVRLAGFEGRIAGEIGPEGELTVAETRGQLDYISIPSLGIEAVDFNVRYQGEDVLFDVDLVVDERRNAQIEGRVDLRPANRVLTVEDLTLQLDEDEWQLLQEATVSYGDEYRVSGLLLYSGDQQIALDGVVDPDGQQNLVFTVESFRIAAVADLLGYEGLGGRLSGSVVLTGPASAPDLDGMLNVDLSSYEEEVGDLVLDLGYDAQRLVIDASLRHDEGGILTAEGSIPMDLRLSPADSATAAGEGVEVTTEAPEGEVDLTVAADSFSIGWIEPFLDPETFGEIAGDITGDFEVSGTLDDPLLSGEARFVEGAINLPEFGVTYSGIQADFTLQGDQIMVREAVMQSGDGELTAQGSIELAELTLGEFDLDLDAENFQAVDNNQYNAVIDADLQLTGSTRRPVLTGALQVEEAEIFLTDELTSPELATVQLTSSDLRTLERRFGIRITEKDTTTFSFYQALGMELDVQMERNTWLRSTQTPEMNVQFSGDLDVQKQPYEDAQVFGSIEVVPERSYIDEFGKRFDLTSGTLTFNGSAGNPLVDVEAEYSVRMPDSPQEQASITLSVNGRLQEQLELDLSSNPPMEMTDIVSFIATGQPAGANLRLGGSGGDALLGTGAGLAFDQLAGFIENVAGAEFGLDVIEIEQTALQGTVITVGEYVRHDLYVSVSQPMTFGQDPTNATSLSDVTARVITVEWQFYDWLMLRFLQRGSTFRFLLLWEHAY